MKRARAGEAEAAGPPPKKTNTGGVPKVQDALGYLEKVKNRFAQQPAVYNQFLDIMKEFKSQSIDTEGVIKRVKSLFRGNRGLILGFNQFLPPGYKIEMDPEPKPTIEFNHAVQYVAKIKQRFKDQPAIYGEFLDILHDYQAKRTIDEVYARVQKLFGDHADLLDEFKYFLPDNSQQPAGAPSKRGPKQLKPPKKSSAEPTSKQRVNSHSISKRKPESGKRPVTSPPSLSASASAKNAAAAGKGEAKAGSDANAKGSRTISYPMGSEKELALFDKIKAGVPRTVWTQFLKCINMFSCEIVNRTELVRIVDGVLGDHSDFSDRFRQAIAYDDWEERQLSLQNRSNYYAFVSSVDFSTCKEVTPSYRQLPDEILIPPCSGRSTLSEQVLNDKCISIPTGSEDFSFKTTRKNIYEENLFKCEDERFELDMILENNAAAIRVLDQIIEQARKLPQEQAHRMRLTTNVDILHVRAIARVYGEQGYEVVELLKRSPATAASVVRARLMQKAEEWKRVKQEMKSHWRKINEQNYQRSLDHRSFYFKQEDKKRRNKKHLISELYEVHKLLHGSPQKGKVKDKQEEEEGAELLRKLNQHEAPLHNYCMRFHFGEAEVHEEVYEILTHVVSLQLNAMDQQKFHTFWLGFVHHFFGVEVTDTSKCVPVASGVSLAAAVAGLDAAPAPAPSPTVSPTAATAAPVEASAVSAEAAAAALLGFEALPATPLETDEDRAAASNMGDLLHLARGGRVRMSTRKKKEAKMDEDMSDEDGEAAEGEEGAEAVGGVESALAVAAAVASSKEGPRGKRKRRNRRAGARAAKKKDSESETDSGDEGRASRECIAPPIKVTTTATEDPSSTTTPAAAGRVKPVRIALSTWELDEALHPVRRHSQPSRLFVGNNPYYVFFRLHQFLYNRLHTARKLSNKHRRTTTSKSKAVPLTPEGRYRQFRDKLTQLLDGEMETARFEDECRSLLGAASFSLFTIDKLVTQMVKHCQSLLQDPSCMQLLSLYQYECSRLVTVKAEDRTPDCSAGLARMYHSNCAALVGDDACMQIEYFEDTQDLGIGVIEGLLAYQLKPHALEGDSEALMVGALAGPSAADSLPFLVRSFDRFLPKEPVTETKPAGKKGRRGPKGRVASAVSVAPEACPDLMAHVTHLSGLEANLDQNTNRLLWVHGTCDVFVRHRNRGRRMQAWDHALATHPASAKVLAALPPRVPVPAATPKGEGRRSKKDKKEEEPVQEEPESPEVLAARGALGTEANATLEKETEKRQESLARVRASKAAKQRAWHKATFAKLFPDWKGEEDQEMKE